ncbi:MAG: 8-oxo-dGTP diphosphatase [Clostridiaceae bacterium]|nr:8-oxo-dGTP diphosphatase [Clostridiaceae bacterium]
MGRTEKTELAVLCLIYDENRFLLQDRAGDDWKGYVLPGGHVEPGESIVDAVIREIREETGLTILNPKLCGIKQFPIEGGDYKNGRYIVFLFRTSEFSGELISSEEGEMCWVDREDLHKINLVEDFDDLIDVMTNDEFNEFQYIVEDGIWKVIKK